MMIPSLPNASLSSSSNFLDFLNPKHSSLSGYLDDEEFMNELGKILKDNELTRGYAAANEPFDFSGAGGGQAMPRPDALTMQGSGSLFGGYNKYLDRRRR
jgi:hypothetical protein